MRFTSITDQRIVFASVDGSKNEGKMSGGGAIWIR
jgi:hypothetical protein